MARVTITIVGADEAIAKFTKISEQAVPNLDKQMLLLARDTEQVWKSVTPVRSGQLRNADIADAGTLRFKLINAIRYYDWVSEGHRTPAGWHRHGRFVPAKRRSQVAGRHMTEKAIDFVRQNIVEYLSKFLDDI